MSKHKTKLLPRLIQGKWRIQATVPVLGMVRKQFADEESAMVEYNRICQQVDNHVAQAEIRETLLDKDQEKEAVSAYHLLKENWESLGDLSLVECVRFCVQKYDRRVKLVTCSEALEHYLEDLASRDRSVSHLNKCETKILRLADFFPAKLVEDFTPEDISSYISDDKNACGPYAGRDVSKTTRHNELVYLRAFFKWCENYKYCKESPCDGTVTSPGREKGEIKALTLPQVGKLLRCAQNLISREIDRGYRTWDPIKHDPDIFVYILLSVYCGLRPEELRPESDDAVALTWEKIIWRQGDLPTTITIDYDVGKVSTRRVLTMPKICQELLEPYKQFEGRVIQASYSELRSLMDTCKAYAGFRVGVKRVKQHDPLLAKVCSDEDRPKWIPDGMRHTAISYKLIHENNNYDLVAEWSGNSPKIIKEHYKALITGTETKTPEQETNEFYGIETSESDSTDISL